jgi:hypothetical protein
MLVSLTLEASRSCGKTYRLGLRLSVPLALIVVALSRLF